MLTKSDGQNPHLQRQNLPPLPQAPPEQARDSTPSGAYQQCQGGFIPYSFHNTLQHQQYIQVQSFQHAPQAPPGYGWPGYLYPNWSPQTGAGTYPLGAGVYYGYYPHPLGDPNALAFNPVQVPKGSLASEIPVNRGSALELPPKEGPAGLPSAIDAHKRSSQAYGLTSVQEDIR